MLATEHFLLVLQCVVLAQGQDVIVGFTRDGANLKGDGGQRERKPSLPSMITQGGMWVSSNMLNKASCSFCCELHVRFNLEARQYLSVSVS